MCDGVGGGGMGGWRVHGVDGYVVVWVVGWRIYGVEGCDGVGGGGVGGWRVHRVVGCVGVWVVVGCMVGWVVGEFMGWVHVLTHT